MNNNIEKWKFAQKKLQSGIPLILVNVAESNESTPGKPGFKMLISSDNEIIGSIGGGIMEYNFIEIARKKLKENDYSIFIKRQVHEEDSPQDRSGMICSGSQWLIILPLIEKDIEIINSILFSLEKKESGVLEYSPEGLRLNSGVRMKSSSFFEITNEKEWHYKENICFNNVLYIIGGGHVGLALSRIMSTLDFYIIIIDNRPNITTLKKNIYVDEKIIISYDKILDYIPDGDENYVVIMTSGHQADEDILRYMLKRKFKYLGMLGSPAKVSQVFDNLQREGFSIENLKKIKSPIGMPINSHTPEEIAVSIAAEIIKIKNGK